MEGFAIFIIYRTLFFLIFFVPNCYGKSSILFSLPGSGSLWFCRTIAQYNKNILFEQELSEAVLKSSEDYFDLQDSFKIVNPTHFITYLQDNNLFYRSTLIFFGINNFLPVAHSLIFYTHRYYVFPTHRTSEYNALYKVFMAELFTDPFLQDIQNYCKNTSLSKIEQQCFIYIILSYCMLKQAQDSDIPIFEYKTFMTLPRKKAKNYLTSKFPDLLLSEAGLNELLRIRRTWTYLFKMTDFLSGIKNIINYFLFGFDWLEYKRQQYLALGVEQKCQKFIAYLKQLDTEFTGWHYLE